MSDERTEEFSAPRLNINLAVADDKRSTDVPRDASAATVNEAKIRMRSRLPALEDDGDVGIEKEHLVTRDGKADLLFMGVLLASAAPASTPKGDWQEYRIYRTNGDKHVFSRVTRTSTATQVTSASSTRTGTWSASSPAFTASSEQAS